MSGEGRRLVYFVIIANDIVISSTVVDLRIASLCFVCLVTCSSKADNKVYLKRHRGWQLGACRFLGNS